MDKLIVDSSRDVVPRIALIYPDGTKQICKLGSVVRGTRHGLSRPIGIEWYEDSAGYVPNDKDIKWLQTELMYVFNPRIVFKDIIKGLING